tara:strand:+ start:286 stop:1083 length:798 start_codon:yes stop_codon:yes gene_type:complete
MDKLTLMNKLLDKSTMSVQEMVDKMGVNRSNYYLWRDKKTVPKKSTINKLAELLGVSLDWEGSNKVKIVDSKVKIADEKITLSNNKEGNNMEVGANYIIELQKDKIQTQEKEIKSLKELMKNKQAESTHWEGLEYDYICHVAMFRVGVGFGRVIESVTDLETQSKILGYSLKELTSFWDCGKKHMTKKGHPIENIINSETQEEIQRQVSSLSMIFDALKSVGGNHYIPQPIIYKHKNGASVGAISYNKVKWSRLKVVSKVKFLTD